MNTATHQFIETGWAGEYAQVAFSGSLVECNAYLAEHGQQADFVRAIPVPRATKTSKAEAARVAARAALLASFGVRK